MLGKLNKLYESKLKKRYLYTLMLMAFLIVLGVGFSNETAKASSGDLPFPPRNVTAVKGDREATISWTKGANGVCSTTEFYVVLYTQNFVYVDESDFMSNLVTSWHVDGLSPSTTYIAQVFSYGSTCDDYNGPASVRFTTNRSNNGSDPTPASGNKKKSPRRVRNLQIIRNPSSTSTMQLTWTKPNVGNSAKRCQPASNIQYDYDIEKYSHSGWTYVAPSTEYVSRVVRSTSSTVTVNITGLHPGGQYRAAVAVYSSECDESSAWRYVNWWQ